MKKLLLLSLLVLFGCSKDSDSKEEAAPGDEIIGTHQIIDIGPTETSYYGYNNISGTISFESNKKGSMDIFFQQSGGRETFNFDWSFDGQRWNLIEQNGYSWTISFFDYYTMIAVDGQYESEFRRLLFY